MTLTHPQLLEMFYFVQLTREVEERLTILYRQNKVVGGLYRSLGQEGESVASAYALAGRDVTASLIRNLGALIARGVRPRDIFAQYMAKGTSPTGGRDLNVHFSHMPEPGVDEPIIIGPRATELVAEATMCLRMECTVEELIRTIHAHPTMSEAVGEAAHAAHGAPIHA